MTELDKVLESVEFNEWMEELEYSSVFNSGRETLEDTGRYPQ